MKALILPVENNRIVQVELNEFPVAEPLYWIDCPDDCSTNWTYVNGQFYPPVISIIDLTIDKLAIITTERDRRLAASDWTQLADAPLSIDLKNQWKNYRQLLRDLPNDPLLDLDNPNWPIPPQ